MKELKVMKNGSVAMRIFCHFAYDGIKLMYPNFDNVLKVNHNCFFVKDIDSAHEMLDEIETLKKEYIEYSKTPEFLNVKNKVADIQIRMRETIQRYKIAYKNTQATSNEVVA